MNIITIFFIAVMFFLTFVAGYFHGKFAHVRETEKIERERKEIIKRFPFFK